jgi:hypothetical protein
MKKLGKIKLNQFSNAELQQRELNALKGGCICGSYGCGCICIGDDDDTDYITSDNGHDQKRDNPLEYVYVY